MSATGLLVVNEIYKRFGERVAVDRVSFQLDEGETVAVAGQNGSGKSTLLKMIFGSIKVDSGTVRFNGKLLDGSPIDSRSRGIEMVFQDKDKASALCEDYPVLENLFLGRELTSRFGFLNKRLMVRRAHAIIDSFELPLPDLRAKARNLSGGQQKLVEIGRTLLSDPKLVLMDEPMAALGVKEQAIVLAVCRKLRARGISILMCTHSPDHMLALATRIVVLRDGKQIADRALKGLTREEIALLIST